MSTPPLRAVLLDAVGTTIHLREPVGETYARVAGGGDPAALQQAFARGAAVAMPPMVFRELDGDGVRAAEREWWRALVRSVFAAAGATLPPRAPSRDSGITTPAPTPGDGAGRATRCCAACQHAACAPAWCRTSTTACRRCSRRSELAPLLDVVVLPCRCRRRQARRAHLSSRGGDAWAIEPAEALYVGDDAEDDIAGASAAGLRALDVAARAAIWRAILAGAE